MRTLEYQKQPELSELENQNLKEKENKRKFKDACDLCNTFDYCIGFNGKVLCKSCINREKSQINLIKEERQLTIFDLI